MYILYILYVCDELRLHYEFQISSYLHSFLLLLLSFSNQNTIDYSFLNVVKALLRSAIVLHYDRIRPEKMKMMKYMKRVYREGEH